MAQLLRNTPSTFFVIVSSSFADASDRVEAVEKWNSECALAEKFQRLVAVKRMVEAGANVAEEPFERQSLEIRRPANGAKRQVHHAN